MDRPPSTASPAFCMQNDLEDKVSADSPAEGLSVVFSEYQPVCHGRTEGREKNRSPTKKPCGEHGFFSVGPCSR